jgi:hypothetical protein
MRCAAYPWSYRRHSAQTISLPVSLSSFSITLTASVMADVVKWLHHALTHSIVSSCVALTAVHLSCLSYCWFVSIRQFLAHQQGESLLLQCWRPCADIPCGVGLLQLLGKFGGLSYVLKDTVLSCLQKHWEGLVTSTGLCFLLLFQLMLFPLKLLLLKRCSSSQSLYWKVHLCDNYNRPITINQFWHFLGL